MSPDGKRTERLGTLHPLHLITLWLVKDIFIKHFQPLADVVYAYQTDAALTGLLGWLGQLFYRIYLVD